MRYVKENLIYLAVSFIIFLFMWSIKPSPHLLPTGIYLPLAQAQASTDPNSIKLFQRIPENAKALGIVRVQYHLDGDELQGFDAITDYAIEKAAQVGANGLVVNLIGHNQNADYPALSGFELMATAITLPRQS